MENEFPTRQSPTPRILSIIPPVSLMQQAGIDLGVRLRIIRAVAGDSDVSVMAVDICGQALDPLTAARKGIL